MVSKRQISERFFDGSVTDTERAVFEGGIALGAIYHQFVGTPIANRKDVVNALSRAIEKTASLQPFRTRVTARIKLPRRKPSESNPYHYQGLSDRHMDVTVLTRYRAASARLRMKYIPSLEYPLMFIEKVFRPASS